MKTKLILASLLATTFFSNAQYITTSGTAPGGTQVFKAGNGTGSLHWASSGGLLIQSQSGDRALLELQNPTAANRTVFQALSNSTYLDISGGTIPLYLMGSGGRMTIGHNNSPSYQVDLRTSATNDGLSITQTGTSAGALHLTNSSAGGGHWALFSTGSGNGQGAGNFSIFQYGGTDRLFIQGSTGNVGIGNINPSLAQLQVEQTTNNNSATGYFVSALNNPSGMNRTLQVEAQNGNYNWAGVFVCNDASCTQNIGVYAATPGNYPANDWAAYMEGHAKVTQNFYVGGNSYFTGNGYFGASMLWSDKRLKKDIKTLEKPMDVIMKLRPTTYFFDQTQANGLHMPEDKQYGLIAQELQEVLPESVKEMVKPADIDPMTQEMKHPEMKILTVNYNSLIPFLIKGMQEQQTTIETLLQSNADLKAEVENLRKTSTTTSIGELAFNGGFSMSQNEPNPFSHETVVKYTLPQTVGTASLYIYDLTGKQITSYPITDKGSSSITLTSKDLAAGIYIYTLVADGKVMDSKRMIVSEK